MEALRHLMKIALAGTAMTTEPVETSAPALDDLLGSMPEASRERRLLAAAGLLAVYAQAGTESIHAEELPAPAEADEWPTLSQRAEAILGRMIEDADLHTLLPATLALMKEKRVRLPETVLPDFLNVKAEYRTAVIPVLGRRGLWLAAQNADWGWALQGLEDAPPPQSEAGEASDLSGPAGLERIWQEGTTAERAAVLRRVRAAAPDTARAWLEETWKKDKADQRAPFIEVLREGLSPADIPFLESIAKDRSQKIRNKRFILLASLPGSSVWKGLREHTGFLELSRPGPQSGLGGLLKNLAGLAEKPRMQVLAPEEVDGFWLEAGVSARPPQGIGVKAWLLQQMLSLIPLDFWQERLEATPEELMEGARDTEWSLSILEGWTRSAIAVPKPEWLFGLVGWWREFKADSKDLYVTARVGQLRGELLPELLAAEPTRTTELVELLLRGGVDRQLPWADVLKSLESPWPAALGRVWLKTFHHSVRSGRDEHIHIWLASLPVAAGALPDECLHEAIREWGLPEKQEGESWVLAALRKSLADFSDRIEMRLVVSEEIHRLSAQNGGTE